MDETIGIRGAARLARPAIRAAGVTDRAVVVAASGLFLLPTALFALALRPLPALVVATACAAAMALIAAGRRDDGVPDEPIDAARLLGAVALAAALLLLGGETHLFFAAPDWQIRDAVLADLARGGLPTGYAIDGATYLLRAPLGMYLAPAAVGRVSGLGAAHAALLAQNALLLGAIFYLLMRLGRGWPHLLVMLLAGGCGLAGTLLYGAFDRRVIAHGWQWGLDSWHPFLQYSAALVQFVWVPNHALPGWWLAVLMLLQRRGRIDVATLGVSVAVLSFWSPLSVLPAVPWLLSQACSRWRSIVLSVRTWAGVAAAAGFAPVLAYMVAASGSIAHDGVAAQPDFAVWYALFIPVALPVLGVLAACRRRIPPDLRSLAAVNGAVLLALPLFSFGPNNDLVMRGSIAALTVVAFVFGAVLLAPGRPTVVAAVGWFLVAAAAPTAAVEVWRAVATPRYAISGCSLMQASHALDGAALPTNYVVERRSMPAWLIDPASAAAAPVEARRCWPDLPPGR